MDVISNDSAGGWRHTGENGSGHTGPTLGLEHIVEALICKSVTNRKQTLIIGAYPPPSTLDNLPDLEEAWPCFQDKDLIVIGNLNTDIDQSQNPHSHHVDTLMLEFV